MSTSGDKPYHHGDLPRVLLAVAREMLRETGPAGLTLRGVAARAAVSPAAPYRHFADRESLLAGLAERGFAELAEAITAPPDTEPLAALHTIGEAYLRFGMREPQLYRLMFGAGVPSRSAHPELAAAEGRLVEIFVAALTRAREAGAIAGHDLRNVGLTLRCVMRGLASLAIDGELPPEHAMDSARRVMDIVDAGLLPR